MGIVAINIEVLDAIIVDAARFTKQPHFRPLPRRALKLDARLLDMVEIKMHIAADPDEFPGREPGLLRDHEKQRHAAGPVERDAKQQIA